MGYVSTLGFEIILQAGIYWFLVFGLWISLRVLRYPDLALENLLTAGAMLTCVGFTATAGGILGLAAKLVFFALVIGFLAFFFWRVLSIHPVIVSLILSYLIYSAILYKFGPNVSGDGLWRLGKTWKSVLLIYGTIAVVSVALFAFQRSLAGRRFIAVACNPDLAKAMGMRTWLYQIGGLVLGVFLTQVSGLFHASYYGYLLREYQ